MEYGYCSTTLIPCRAEASDKSEMVNQLLFGETYEVLETAEKWLRIKTIQDKYESWIGRKLHTPLSGAEFSHFQTVRKTVYPQLGAVLHVQSQTPVVISHGAILPIPENGSFSIGSNNYQIQPVSVPINDLSQYSFQFLNTPYLWGGKSLFGADCSGFTQVVFRVFNQFLPRDAWQQAELGETIQLADVKSGDLAFFGKPEGKITHVGICLDNNRIIHCSGRCRIDILNETGILNTETNEYSHDFRLIKRI